MAPFCLMLAVTACDALSGMLGLDQVRAPILAEPAVRVSVASLSKNCEPVWDCSKGSDTDGEGAGMPR